MKPQARLDLLNQVLKDSMVAPFYRRRLDGRPLASLEEISRLPLLTRDDLQRHSPFGLVCVPREELYQYHESFGTTGAPVATDAAVALDSPSHRVVHAVPGGPTVPA
ncbi:MAG: hypothetical protein QHH02_09245, partial [Syntrophomonadaceae bacterium]|nr:hypothetical protein [Syntrophomonadaceae bacterium]